jgi:hypothetical protein
MTCSSSEETLFDEATELPSSLKYPSTSSKINLGF